MIMLIARIARLFGWCFSVEFPPGRRTVEDGWLVTEPSGRKRYVFEKGSIRCAECTCKKGWSECKWIK